ncbi:MAG: hypothetical protein CVU99_09095 [Firmicutes bacterium HGW-Firmicutes-4]|nr:MAG: hypothetical protein CVV25_13415 [Ignavibacteriae bacterium HGW-Ignavibacteriae-4]PKM60252.1 MAG: hypothetical protein CVU99_09095 [Firmicutes bacterium HGW-Firmicutes-4]
MKGNAEELIYNTKISCESMVDDLNMWKNELRNRHEGLLSRVRWLDSICYLFMGSTSIYFIFLFSSWIFSFFNGLVTSLPVG